MNGSWDKLKERWGVTKSWQVIMILVVFTVTGFSVSFLHNLINPLIGIGYESSFLIKALSFSIIILPLYIIVLYIWATILGQKEFFTRFIIAKWNMLKKLFGF